MRTWLEKVKKEWVFSVNHLVLTHCLTEESYFERGECLMGNLTFTEFCLTH